MLAFTLNFLNPGASLLFPYRSSELFAMAGRLDFAASSLVPGELEPGSVGAAGSSARPSAIVGSGRGAEAGDGPDALTSSLV